jgi:hypothetical protein
MSHQHAHPVPEVVQLPPRTQLAVHSPTDFGIEAAKTALGIRTAIPTRSVNEGTRRKRDIGLPLDAVSINSRAECETIGRQVAQPQMGKPFSQVHVQPPPDAEHDPSEQPALQEPTPPAGIPAAETAAGTAMKRPDIKIRKATLRSFNIWWPSVGVIVGSYERSGASTSSSPRIFNAFHASFRASAHWRSEEHTARTSATLATLAYAVGTESDTVSSASRGCGRAYLACGKHQEPSD